MSPRVSKAPFSYTWLQLCPLQPKMLVMLFTSEWYCSLMYNISTAIASGVDKMEGTPKTGRGGLWQLWSSGPPAPEFTEPLCVTRSSCCCHPQEPPESDSKKSRRGKILLQSGLTLNSYLGRYILGLYSRHIPAFTWVATF